MPCLFTVSDALQKGFSPSPVGQEEAHKNIYIETVRSLCHLMLSPNICESY